MVVDAGVLIEALAIESSGGPVGQRLSSAVTFHAPCHLCAEFTNGVRRLELQGIIAPDRAEGAINDFLALPITQHRFKPLLHRVWALRNNLSSYDAGYVAVAENLGEALFTTDERLARAPGLRCHVVVV